MSRDLPSHHAVSMDPLNCKESHMDLLIRKAHLS
jgi:hypothetical protein